MTSQAKTDPKPEEKKPEAAKAFDLMADPVGNVKNAPQMNDLLRQINNAERNLVGPLELLASAARSTPETGAAEFYDDAVVQIRDLLSAVRVAQFNHQKFVDAKR